MSIPHLDKVAKGQSLSESEMAGSMRFIMEGKAQEADLKSFLLTLADRGETVEEITGAAKVLREKAFPIKAPEGTVDCCGTGGDCSGTYNISTGVALVAAACGVPVAKHGNRAASSRSGAADVLEALGVNLDAPREILESALKNLNFAFLMAPKHHEAMRHVGPVRKELGRRTIFNLLGPLANPAGARYQLLGVFDKKWCGPLAQTLKALGTKAAWVVHGADGLDEITVTGPTYVSILKDGVVSEKEMTPADFGLTLSKPEELKGGDAFENAAALKAILKGAHNAYRDIVVANTAAVLFICALESDLKSAAAKAQQALDSGQALQILENYIAMTKKEAAP